MDFYKRLNYSLGNEDWRVEEQALRVTPGDRVICVTASGDRPLHLLMTDCAEIISIDMNSIQNFLLDLKLSAILNLDYEQYLAFLGCTPTKHRHSIYTQLKPHLQKDTALFWDQHKRMINKGILYQGMVERLTYAASRVLNVLRHKKIKTLMSFSDLELQRNYLAKEWNTRLWEKGLKLLLNSNSLKYVINDPGLNAYVDSSIKPGTYIYDRMDHYLNHYLAKTSPLLQLILTGRLQPEAYFPYLKLDGYSKIRQRAERLNYKTTNIVEFLNNFTANEVDAFSMSDIASYMPQNIFCLLLQGIKNAARPGARFCLREFMTKRQIPDDMKPNFVRDNHLEKKLEDEESNFVYRFLVGEIQK